MQGTGHFLAPSPIAAQGPTLTLGTDIGQFRPLFGRGRAGCATCGGTENSAPSSTTLCELRTFVRYPKGRRYFGLGGGI